jgi:SAM-dependent methyltransferase
MDPIERMREDWDRWAREDAYYYAGFGRRNQDQREFFSSAAEVLHTLTRELVRLPEAQSRRALEIGCGPGRLMLPMSAHFGEIHGVDISGEMAARARENLRGVPHAHVHVTPGDGLGMFAGEYFDFIYSYIVFQHIPDPMIVLNYLREARRTLKTGGVLCCQLRGAPPLHTEIERHESTWTGCFFTGERMAAFAREHDFHLVALSGLNTQYMWTTWLKPAPSGAPDFSRTVLKAVTAASRVGPRVTPETAGSWRDFFSLWIDGLPQSCHLGNLEVAFNQAHTRGCYLSPITKSGACQLNVRLPDGVRPGPAAVMLYCDGRALGEPVSIEVPPPPPRSPKVISVSDGVDIESKYRVVMGGVKVTIEDIDRPEEVSFTVDGRPVECGQFECKDPVTSTYEFAFLLSRKTRLGTRLLVVRASGRKFPPIPIEIAGLVRQALSPANSQDRDQQHGRGAEETSDAPLPSAIVGKRNLARALAGWFQHQKPQSILGYLRRRRAPTGSVRDLR